MFDRHRFAAWVWPDLPMHALFTADQSARQSPTIDWSDWSQISQEEHFQVLQGAIHTVIDQRPRTYWPGEDFRIPAGISHAMHNTSAEAGRVLWQIRPALQTEILFETLWGLARDGKTNEYGVPGLLQLAVLLQTYNQELRLTRPSYRLQRLVWGALGRLGRWKGYRSRYAMYSGPLEG